MPEGSTPTFSTDTDLSPSFLPDVPGDYVPQLVAYDGFAYSTPSTVAIHVAATQSWVTNRLRTLISEQIANPQMLTDAALKNKNLRNSLINKLNAVIKTADAGNYTEALAKLRDDILAKTNGCAETGQPDSNDWIISCDQQQMLSQEIHGIMANLTEVMSRP